MDLRATLLASKLIDEQLLQKKRMLYEKALEVIFSNAVKVHKGPREESLHKGRETLLMFSKLICVIWTPYVSGRHHDVE